MSTDKELESLLAGMVRTRKQWLLIVDFQDGIKSSYECESQADAYAIVDEIKSSLDTKMTGYSIRPNNTSAN